MFNIFRFHQLILPDGNWSCQNFGYIKSGWTGTKGIWLTFYLNPTCKVTVAGRMGASEINNKKKNAVRKAPDAMKQRLDELLKLGDNGSAILGYLLCWYTYLFSVPPKMPIVLLCNHSRSHCTMLLNLLLPLKCCLWLHSTTVSAHLFLLLSSSSANNQSKWRCIVICSHIYMYVYTYAQL